MDLERTFIMVKPDGVQRLLIGEIISRLERRGFKLIAIKIMWPSDDILVQHYHELVDKPYFPKVMQYLRSGPTIPMIWEGENVVQASRVLIGKTAPLESPAGSIRGDFCIDLRRNLVHGSSSLEGADKEIALWFKNEEIIHWNMSNKTWIKSEV